MTGRKMVGLCTLCALFFGTCAIQSAAATKGTTAFTCKAVTPSGGTAGFSREHCKPEDAVGSFAGYEHVAIAENTTTQISASNETTIGGTAVTKIASTQSGITLELQATGLHGEGWVRNEKDSEPNEHYVHGEVSLVYTGVTVTKPAGKGCKIYTDAAGTKWIEGVIDTEPLTFTTTGQGDFIKIEPAKLSGGLFATFIIEGCTVAALNGTYKLQGSVKGTPDGATTNFTLAATTEQGTLTLRGQKTGIDGSLTIKGKDPFLGDPSYTPLSFTTVETP